MIDYYKRVLRKINSIKNKNKRAEKITFGYSVLGRKIEGLFFNFNKKETFIIQASIHAREYITTSFLLKVANVVAGCDEKTTCALPNLLFIFLSNPDGVMLVKNGLKSVKNIHYKRFLYNLNNKNVDFGLFKANVNGVDLNNNFDANFGKDPRYKDKPSAHGYPGPFCFSEPETKALKIALEKFKPVFTISLHTKGEEIYYDFWLNNAQKNAHKNLAKIFANELNYTLVDGCGLSCGGFKDYCVSALKIPSITIEMASDYYSYPLPKRSLCDIIKKTNCFIDAIKKAYNYILENKGRF